MLNFNKYALWKDVSLSDWTDWKWQYQNCITSVDELSEVINLSNDEIIGIEEATKYYRMKISPHICLLIAEHPNTAISASLKRQFFPSSLEVIEDNRLFSDVNSDSQFMPVKGLVHRYPTKVLIFPSNNCGTFCRYCFRKKYVGGKETQLSFSELNPIFSYLKVHGDVNEVIFSGGDPLTATNDKIEYILERLSQIESIHIVRFHSRMPITIPYRIDEQFIDILDRYRHRFATYFVVHIDTMNELSDEALLSISKMTDMGISCLASCPLLKGINDSEESLGNLWQFLVENQIKPYYLFHTDPVVGIRHFVVPLERGLEIMQHLYDKVSGVAIPLYCFNVPNGGGHILLSPPNVKKVEEHHYKIVNFEGKVFDYTEPLDNN